jgi:hypothetical protein
LTDRLEVDWTAASTYKSFKNSPNDFGGNKP